MTSWVLSSSYQGYEQLIILLLHILFYCCQLAIQDNRTWWLLVHGMQLIRYGNRKEVFELRTEWEQSKILIVLFVFSHFKSSVILIGKYHSDNSTCVSLISLFTESFTDCDRYLLNIPPISILPIYTCNQLVALSN